MPGTRTRVHKGGTQVLRSLVLGLESLTLEPDLSRSRPRPRTLVLVPRSIKAYFGTPMLALKVHRALGRVPWCPCSSPSRLGSEPRCLRLCPTRLGPIPLCLHPELSKPGPGSRCLCLNPNAQVRVNQGQTQDYSALTRFLRCPCAGYWNSHSVYIEENP